MIFSPVVLDKHGYVFGAKIIDDNRAETVAEIPVM